MYLYMNFFYLFKEGAIPVYTASSLFSEKKRLTQNLYTAFGTRSRQDVCEITYFTGHWKKQVRQQQISINDHRDLNKAETSR